jgi:hypothetical protein
MSAIVSCPTCQKYLKVDEAVLGKKIKCPTCGAVFTTSAPVAAAPPPEKTARRERDEERPRTPARDDEDERERRRRGAQRRRRREDDEEEERSPRPRGKANGSTGTVLLVIGGVVLFLCAGCGGLSYYIYAKINEGVRTVQAAMTDAQARMATEAEARAKTATVRDVPAPTKPGPEKPKPPEDQLLYASEQQFADAMFENENEAFGRYVRKPLQLTGVVRKVTVTPLGGVSEIFFEPQVEDLKTHQKKPFAINCRLPQAVAQASALVGGTVTVRGRLTGGSKTSATLNECVVVSTIGPTSPPPGNPAGPGHQPQLIKADDFGKTLYEGQQAAFREYARKPLIIEGVVHQQTPGPGGAVAEVVFQTEVKDKKTGTMQPFLILCKFATPLPGGDKAADLAVGKTVTVRGKLSQYSAIGKKATLTECALAGASP